ncbi:MAG TPA: FKBP-type peptidyl-prolyl cis-trans isomerase [Burkholderiales bacterium]|nr:FKBP-type peptidyl-prolyl cis-trans isomerase [Burkholderiales bacterium]
MRLPALLALALLARAAIAANLPDAPPDQLLVIDEKPGDGPELTRGNFGVAHYEGWVFDANAPDRKGRKFDSSRERGRALSFYYSPGRIIEGWYKGLAGMKAGGRRVLVVPPALGYGERYAFGVVPPNSTLLFEIELLDVVPRQNPR